MAGIRGSSEDVALLGDEAATLPQILARMEAFAQACALAAQRRPAIVRRAGSVTKTSQDSL